VPIVVTASRREEKMTTVPYAISVITADDIRLSGARTVPEALFRGQIDPYFRHDLRAEYEFWKKQASVAVGVSNLIDPGHYEGGTSYFNNAEVPRMVYAEFRMTIK
jgi:outer membrane receptor protein involved in Fe transport